MANPITAAASRAAQEAEASAVLAEATQAAEDNAALDSALEDTITAQKEAEATVALQEASTPAPNAITAKLKATQAATEANTVNTQANLSRLDEIMATVNETAAATNEKVSIAGKAAMDTALIVDTAKMQAQNATIKMNTELGGNETSTLYAMALKKANDAAIAASQEHLAIMSREPTGISFIDGALNEISSIQSGLELEAAKQAVNVASRAIAGKANAVESTARVQTMVSKNITAASIENNQKEMTGKLSKEMLAADRENLFDNMRGIAANQSATLQDLSAQQKQVSLEAAEEARTFSKQEAAARNVRWTEEAAAREVSLESARLALELNSSPQNKEAFLLAKEASVTAANNLVAFNGELVKAVQDAQAAIGAEQESPATIIAGYNSRLGDVAEKYSNLRVAGLSPNQSIGSNAAEAAEVLRINPHGESPIADFLDDKRDQADVALDPATGKIVTNPAAKQVILSGIIDNDLARMRSNIVVGDNTNLYQAAPLPALAEEFNMVLNDPFYLKMLSGGGEGANRIDAVQEVNLTQLLTLGTNAIEVGLLTKDQVVTGIHTIFTAAAAHNNKAYGGFERFGIPSQNSFNTSYKRRPTAFEKLKVAAKAGAKFNLGMDISGDPFATSRTDPTTGLRVPANKLNVPLNPMDRLSVEKAIAESLSVSDIRSKDVTGTNQMNSFEAR